MKLNKLYLLTSVLFLTYALQLPALSLPSKSSQHFFIGPETYYAKREKKGGTKQTGWLFGERTLYERKVTNGFYVAFDGFYARGRLSGKTASGKKIKSKFTEKEIEGRLGYSLCFQLCRRLVITPFGCYGYYCNKNKFIDPSPLKYTSRDHFHYGGGGLGITMKVSRCLTGGVHFTAKYMFEGKNEVKDDPDYDDVKLIVENEMQYEATLPFRYLYCYKQWKIVTEFSPFYRFRHFGGRPNYPFDFIETKFHNYGASLMVNLVF